MANVFLVYTPFQLLISQQIIRQENLTDNILVQGYVAGSPHFLEIYEVMCIEGMWQRRITFPHLPDWAFVKVRSLRDFRFIYQSYKRLKQILEDNQAECIYLGESGNLTLRFTNVLFAAQGYKVVYFEEGYAHYVQDIYKGSPSILLKLKIWMRDMLYYLPLYHVRFAKWLYIPNLPVGELPIYRRYSILPINHEAFDVQLRPVSLVSENVREHVKKEVGVESFPVKRILLLTQPLREVISDANIPYYFEVISEALNELPKDVHLYLKYHPRDTMASKERVEEIVRGAGLEYTVLSREVNLPVEYYLQEISFRKVLIFMSSTFAYNGYLYPKCEFVKLLPRLYQKMKEHVGDMTPYRALQMCMDVMS